MVVHDDAPPTTSARPPIPEPIARTGVVAIARGVSANDAVGVAEALQVGGVRAFEVTLNGEGALDAIEALAAYAFAQRAQRKLYAYVHAQNCASRRAFERAGFTLEATLEREALRDGREADVHRLSRFARERNEH